MKTVCKCEITDTIAYMETVTIILSIIQTMSISLGVGSSTMAILNFFKAIADGSIDPVERGFMGITYIVLRVAMVLILLTTAGLAAIGQVGTEYTNNFILAQFLLTTVLFINATLMTAKVMPSTLGPAIQAASWYALGFTLALLPHGLTNFNFPIFLACYVVFICAVAYLVRHVMAYLAKKRSVISSGS
jgi:hypothetical protein